jgi:hypothetical protein
MGIIILIVVNIQKKSTMPDKRPKNEKGQRHGHWMLYWTYAKVMFDLHFVNGIVSGPFTQYDSSGLIEIQGYYAR